MMREEVKRSSTSSTYVDDDQKPIHTCPYCNKEFTDYSSWYLHKQLHTSTEVFRCHLCSYTCRVKKYLSRHLKFHRPPTEYTCQVCGKGFHFKCKMDNHMRVHTKDKPFVCTVCGKPFSSSYSLSTHMLTHSDEKPFQCSYCAYACRDSSTLRKHEERHIGTGKLYDCQICNKNYKCKWQLKSHLEEKHFGLKPQTYPCQLCSKLFKSKYTVKKHVKVVHEKSLTCACAVCGLVISSKSNLAQHMRRHVDVTPYKCTFTGCGRRFKEKSDLRKHAIIHYPEKQHPCGICGRLFARRHRLAQHVAAHAARPRSRRPRPRAVECHHCGVLFYSKNYLLRHIKRIHDRKRKKFICDLCNFTTSNKPSLVIHLKYRHSDRRNRKCDLCNKEYTKHGYLKRHYLKTHNIRFKTLSKQSQMHPIEIKEEPDEDIIEYHPEIDLLEIHKEELVEPEYSDPIKYSETVLNEDISRSIMQRDKRTLGEPENEFDSFFIDHVVENSDKSVENSDKSMENSNKYNVEEHRMDRRHNSVETDVENLVKFDGEGLDMNSRENCVEIDVEKLDKFNVEASDSSSVEESDDSMEKSDDYCVEDPDINSSQTIGENLLEHFVKPVKIFVEKLDKHIVEKAVNINTHVMEKMEEVDVENFDKTGAEKSVKISVEKLDMDSIRKNAKMNISNPRKYNKNNNISVKNNSLKVSVEKLDVNRLKKLRKIRVKQSDASYVVNINKNNLGRRSCLKRGRKRVVSAVKNLNIIPKKSTGSTPEPDVTDYSKSVMSEDISRCLQERAGRTPGEPENRLESIFIDHYMEKPDKTAASEWESEGEVSAYSRKVLAEDVSRSVMRRDGRVAGDPEADIDRLFIDHLMEKPDKHSVELVKKNVDARKERYVKKCVDKMLQQIRAQKEAAILEEMRRKYNERINELAAKANKREHINIKYFKNKISEGSNDIGTTNDENRGLITDQIADNDRPVDQIVENNNIDLTIQENDEPIGDGIENENVDTTFDGPIDEQIAVDDNIDTRNDENDDDDVPVDDEGIEKRNNKFNFNTHQCYVCFELFKTKTDLTHHCKEHFQICNYKMLKKCPYCGHVTNLDMRRHLRLEHDVKIDLFNTQMTEKHDETGPKYYLQAQQCTLEVIPSINNLNRQACLRIDENNRTNKNNEISTAKLVKTGTEWVVDKDILKVTNDFKLPEFTDEEYMSLNIPGDKYEDMMKKLSFLAKKRGLKMLYPCDECDKVCRKMCSLVLHHRIHEENPKPFKGKPWKERVIKTTTLVKNYKNNGVKVITTVRNSKEFKEFTENQIKRRKNRNMANRTTISDNYSGYNDGIASTTADIVASDDNINGNSRKLVENRFAEPKPIVNKHKCEKELMEFYKNNIKGGDIEFWQFLKIFNKMRRENVNDFKDLEARTDFGIQYKDSNIAGNAEDEISVNSNTTNTVEGSNTISNTEKLKMNKNEKVAMKERQGGHDINNELRNGLEYENIIG